MTQWSLDWLQDQCFLHTSLHSNALCHWKPLAVLKLLLCHFFPNLAFWRALENPTEVRESVASTAWTCRAIAAGLSSTCPVPARTTPPFFCKIHTHTIKSNKRKKRAPNATNPIPTETLGGLQGCSFNKVSTRDSESCSFLGICKVLLLSHLCSRQHMGGFWEAVCWISTLLWLRYEHTGKLIYP